jgi:hypothetical protein
MEHEMHLHSAFFCLGDHPVGQLGIQPGRHRFPGRRVRRIPVQLQVRAGAPKRFDGKFASAPDRPVKNPFVSVYVKIRISASFALFGGTGDLGYRADRGRSCRFERVEHLIETFVLNVKRMYEYPEEVVAFHVMLSCSRRVRTSRARRCLK